MSIADLLAEVGKLRYAVSVLLRRVKTVEDSGGSGGGGTVTPSSADNFTNKTGNISQWTNDSGYALTSALSAYQTTANLQSNLTASTTKYPSVNAVNTGLGLKQDSLGYTPVNQAGSYADPSFITSLAKSKVGLGNVDNTSDASKPISTATATALSGKQATLGYTPVHPIAAKVRSFIAQADIAMKSNPRNNGVMSSPPTVTVNETGVDGALSKYYTMADNFNVKANHPFTIMGGTARNYEDYIKIGAATAYTTGGNVGDGVSGTGWRVGIITDAPKITFRVIGNNPYRFLVNGQYISLSTYTNAGGGFRWITLTFASRLEREIQIESNQGRDFGGVYVTPLDTVSQMPNITKMIIVGDSYAQGTGTTITNDGFPWIAGDFLGFKDTVGSGVGGEGWNSANGSDFTPIQRINDWITKNPDIVVFALGINGFDETGYQAAVTSVLTATRTALPNIPIIVLGAWAGSPGPNSQVLLKEPKIQAAVTALADPYMKFVPVSTDPKGAWVYGTGRVGATTGDGNMDVYISSDQTHPNDAGHFYLGYRTAIGIYNALKSMI